MATNNNQNDNNEQKWSLKGLIQQATTTESILLMLFLGIVFVVILFGIILGPIMDGVSFLERFGVQAATIAILSAFALFLICAYVLRLLQILGDKTNLQQKIANLEQELTIEQLARSRSEEHYKELYVILEQRHGAIETSFMRDTRQFIDNLLTEIEFALHFKNNPVLASPDLKTTHIQLLDDSDIMILIPLGSQHGIIHGLPFYVELASSKPNLIPARLAYAFVDRVMETSSSAKILQHNSNNAVSFWENRRRRCQDSGDERAIEEQLSLQPGINVLSEDFTTNELKAIQAVLLLIRNRISTIKQTTVEVETLRQRHE